MVVLRLGPVLSPAGGMLEKMLAPFRMGIGGRVGNGRQYVSWLDLDDMTGIILHAIMDRELQGPVNACAPCPVPNATFADVLGRVLGRPTLMPLPSLVVRAAMGEMGRRPCLRASVLNQRASSNRLLLPLRGDRGFVAVSAGPERAESVPHGRHVMSPEQFSPLQPEELNPDPLEQFDQWFEVARTRGGVEMPEAACLSPSTTPATQTGASSCSRLATNVASCSTPTSVLRKAAR